MSSFLVDCIFWFLCIVSMSCKVRKACTWFLITMKPAPGTIGKFQQLFPIYKTFEATKAERADSIQDTLAIEGGRVRGRGREILRSWLLGWCGLQGQLPTWGSQSSTEVLLPVCKVVSFFTFLLLEVVCVFDFPEVRSHLYGFRFAVCSCVRQMTFFLVVGPKRSDFDFRSICRSVPFCDYSPSINMVVQCGFIGSNV